MISFIYGSEIYWLFTEIVSVFADSGSDLMFAGLLSELRRNQNGFYVIIYPHEMTDWCKDGSYIILSHQLVNVS